MGNPLFGVNISGLIKEYIGPGVLDATLTKSTPGSRTAGQLTGGRNPTTASYACKGFIDKQARQDFDGTLISDGQVMIVLIGDTIDGGSTKAEAGDRITIEGVTYMIDKLDRDPAAATYTCLSTPQ